MTTDNTYQGANPLGTAYWGAPNHGVCPGCGRCKDCGRPYETAPVQPFTPWPGYPNPYFGDPLYPYPGSTWISSSSGSMQINSTPNVMAFNSARASGLPRFRGRGRSV